MKMARTAAIMQPRFQEPTVRPTYVSIWQYCVPISRKLSVAQDRRTSHPSIVKRGRGDYIDLWESLKEGGDSKEPSHDSLCVAIASVKVLA